MKLEEKSIINSNEKSQIKVRFYRAKYPCKNKDKKGAFTKEFQSIRELHQFIEMLNKKRTDIYAVDLFTDLTPSQYQAFAQNGMNKVNIRKAIEKHKKSGISKFFYVDDTDNEKTLRGYARATYKSYMKRL